MSKSKNAIEDWVFPCIWAGFLLLFLGVTFPLWFSYDPTLSVPLLGIAHWLPVWFAGVVSAGTCIAAAAVILTRNGYPWFWWIIAATLLMLFVLDQYRLQPWAYQTAIYAMVFASTKPAVAGRWLLPVATSIYLYSAAGKFDYQFVHTVGVDFLNTIIRSIGGRPDDWAISTRSTLAYLFPATELALGILLLPRRTRRWAGAAAILMHISLIGILGPWGQDHSRGVLIWNLLLMIQAWFLFLAPAKAREEVQVKFEGDAAKSPPGAMLARMVVVLAIVMPLTERYGCWDHWPSWALYSPHNSRFDVEIHRSGIELLPADMSPFVKQDSDGDGWHALSLARWSLEIRRVPIYPQARYQLGLAVAISESQNLDDQIRGRLRGVSDRTTGKRTETQLMGRTELQQATKQFWLLPHSDT